MLPGANCGWCGFPGCAGFASAIVSGESPTLAPCKVSKKEAKEKIQAYLKETPGPDGQSIDVKL
jgi:electron transport complex protein RnfB